MVAMLSYSGESPPSFYFSSTAYLNMLRTNSVVMSNTRQPGVVIPGDTIIMGLARESSAEIEGIFGLENSAMLSYTFYDT